MASNLNTPASVLNAPVLTPVMLYAHSSSNREYRRLRLGKDVPGSNVPARRVDLVLVGRKTSSSRQYVPAW
jgi:hypothetical protein